MVSFAIVQRDSRSAEKEFPRLYPRPQGFITVFTNCATETYLSQLYPVHILTNRFFKIYFNTRLDS
jgi:hypothetical protein